MLISLPRLLVVLGMLGRLLFLKHLLEGLHLLFKVGLVVDCLPVAVVGKVRLSLQTNSLVCLVVVVMLKRVPGRWLVVCPISTVVLWWGWLSYHLLLRLLLRLRWWCLLLWWVIHDRRPYNGGLACRKWWEVLLIMLVVDSIRVHLVILYCEKSHIFWRVYTVCLPVLVVVAPLAVAVVTRLVVVTSVVVVVVSIGIVSASVVVVVVTVGVIPASVVVSRVAVVPSVVVVTAAVVVLVCWVVGILALVTPSWLHIERLGEPGGEAVVMN